MKTLLILGVFLSISLFSTGASAQRAVTVRVRLIYLINGKPAKHEHLILDLGDPQHMSAEEWRDQTRSPGGVTGSDGVAAFRVPEPFPNMVFVEYESGQIEGCARENPIPLQQVLTHGVTIGVDKELGEACRGDLTLIKRMQAKPGEIVIFVRKLTWWDNLKRY